MNQYLLTVATLLLVQIFAIDPYDSQRIITKEFTEMLKKTVTWEVAEYEDNIFNKWTFDQARSLVSHGFTPDSLSNLMTPSDSQSSISTSDSALPDAYDFRSAYPDCNHPIRNQGKCGSCWAFGSVESLGHRFCKHGKNEILSAQEVVSCSTEAEGCGGGYLDHAFDYFTEIGVTTEKCNPYESQTGKVPSCKKTCKNPSDPLVRYKCKAGTSKYLPHDLEKLKTELMDNGPIAATFIVYRDFYYYKGGIYYHQTGEYLGVHAVEAIGWGKENDVTYWIITNSWGADWGESGYFRMKIDDSGISKGMMSCTPLL